jgi:hypothetical protein
VCGCMEADVEMRGSQGGLTSKAVMKRRVSRLIGGEDGNDATLTARLYQQIKANLPLDYVVEERSRSREEVGA